MNGIRIILQRNLLASFLVFLNIVLNRSLGELFDFGDHKFYIEYKASYILRDK